MIVLAVWIAAVVVALVVFAALGLGLYGHLRRFTRAAETVQGDVTASLTALRGSLANRTSHGISGMDDRPVD